jgi:hypothetical protein
MKIELSLEEINTILSSLGQQPYVQVSQLIEKIRTQVVPQLPKADGEE